jgi:peptide/nickel transport system permease protein
MPVFLWTDRLVFILIALIAIYAAYTRGREHLLAPWKRVGRSASGLSALVVLIAFVTVGVLDSLHFRPALEGRDAKGERVYSVEVRSVLDVVLASLREHTERTYSAPLATRAYAREIVELPDGKEARDYPRLRWGGAQLKSESDRTGDILVTTLRGLISGILASAVLGSLLVAKLSRAWKQGFFAAWKGILRGETAVPWRAVIATVTVMLAIASAIGALASHYHVFGTDKVGQDILYQALKSVRTGLVIGTITTLVMMPFAVLLGIAAGYFRGWADDVIQYLYTTLNSVPSVLLIAAFVLMLQVMMDKHAELFPTVAQRADVRLLALCLILGVTSWTGLARLLRGESLKLRELEYIQAAQAFGVSDTRIITRHILPNVMHIVLISLVMDFSGLVLAEAVLSYVGVGVDPSMISFGTMINAARLEMSRDPVVWWALAAAFIFMFALVLAANIFADAVRDAFDPRVRVGATGFA